MVDQIVHWIAWIGGSVSLFAFFQVDKRVLTQDVLSATGENVSVIT